MELDNKASMAKMLAMFTTGDVTGLEDLISPGYVDHQDNRFAGEEGWLKFYNVVFTLRLQYPDIEVTVRDLISEADRVGVWLEWKATSVEGSRVEAKSFDIVRFEDGRAAEHWGISSGWP